MNLAEFLKPSAVTINTDITSKKRALEEVSRLLTAHAELVSEKDVLTSLINREKLGSTGLGAGVAIPHGRLKGLESAVAAFVTRPSKAPGMRGTWGREAPEHGALGETGWREGAQKAREDRGAGCPGKRGAGRK